MKRMPPIHEISGNRVEVVIHERIRNSFPTSAPRVFVLFVLSSSAVSGSGCPIDFCCLPLLLSSLGDHKQDISERCGKRDSVGAATC